MQEGTRTVEEGELDPKMCLEYKIMPPYQQIEVQVHVLISLALVFWGI
jgi:hypothetical protein